MRRMSGFSLMEMMVVLLITSIVAAASAPMINKKLMHDQAENGTPWVYTGTDNSIAFNIKGVEQSVSIGSPRASVKNTPKLYIKSNENPHIVFDDNNDKMALQVSNSSVLLTNHKEDDSLNKIDSAVAIGKRADASNNSIAIGRNTKADVYGVAIGPLKTVSVPNLGLGPSITAYYYNTTASEGSVAIGTEAKADGNGSVALGTSSSALKDNSVALGADTKAKGNSSVAIGKYAEAKGTNSIAISAGEDYTVSHGFNQYTSQLSTVASDLSVAIGFETKAEGNGSVAIGRSMNATGNHSTAIGYITEASGENSTAIGPRALAKKESSVAIGTKAKATEENSVAIGADAKATVKDQIVLGTENSTVYIPGNLVVDGKTILGRKNNKTSIYATGATNGIRTFRWGADHDAGHHSPEYTDSFVNEINNLYKEYNTTSDRRLKNVGKAFAGGLDEIKKLEVFNYTFKKDPTKTPRVGVMAQDLEKIFPDAVTKGDDGFLRIRMEDMFYAVVNAIKELDRKFDLLAQKQKKIDELEARLDKLEKRLEKLEKNKH